MPQNVQKKTTSLARRKTQISTTKSRKTVQRPKKTMAGSGEVLKITPVMIDKKEEVVIMPEERGQMESQTQQAQMREQGQQTQGQMQQTQRQEQGQAQKQTKQMQTQMQTRSMMQRQRQKRRQGQTQMHSEGRQVINMATVNKKMQMQNAQVKAAGVKTAREIKEEAIEKAIKSTVVEPQTKKKYRPRRVSFGFKRIALALACAAAAVFAIVYFVNLSTPDISLRVAAIQNGIDAVYPKYIPRGYDLSDITSESGRITLNFKNSSNGDSFTITEEKSAWDSNALFSNYVKPNYSSDYTTIKEQGLTIYIDSGNACWANGGIVYKLNVTSGSLTKKQITTIATTR